MIIKKISVVFFITLLLSSCGGKGQEGEAQDKPQDYPTMVVSEQDTQLETTYPVTLKGQQDIEIRPRIDGFIKEIYVDEGSLVRKGQIMFKIDSPLAEQTLGTAKGAVESAQAAVKTAQLNVERLRPLAEKGIISNTQLQTAQNSYDAANGSLIQAQAALKNAHAMVSWTNVTSPVDGIVGVIGFREGSLVNNNNILTTVANTGNIYAYFSINEKKLMELFDLTEGKSQSEKIKNMPPVTLTLADGTVYGEKGKIETISGSVNVTTGSVNFRAEFPNKSGLLRNGSSGTITIPRTLEKAIVIPQKATMIQQNKTIVYKVQGDSVIQVPIQVTPLSDGKNFVVDSGLSSGDRIAVEGIQTLTNGKKVNPQ